MVLAQAVKQRLRYAMAAMQLPHIVDDVGFLLLKRSYMQPVQGLELLPPHFSRVLP